MSLDLGTLAGKITLDTSPFERALSASLGKVKSWTSEVGGIGRKGGENLGDGVYRGADGRLRDLHGRFVAAGKDAGKGLGDGAEPEARKAGQRSGEAFEGGFNAKQVVGRIGGALAAIGVTAFAGSMVKMGVDTASSLETAAIGFETMLGSAEEAQSFIADMQDFAARTPFDFPGLQTAATSLVSIGVETDRVLPIMTTLGDVTSGMGTGAEGIQRATRALQQMNAAQRISGEDLNQLRDAGIPVYDLLAGALGKTKQEVVELAQSGGLGKDALDAMMSALETGTGLERFAGLMDKQSESLAGMTATFQDTVEMGMAEAVQPLLPKLKEGLEWLSGFLETSVFPAVTSGIGWVADAASGALAFIKDGDFTSEFASAFGVEEDSGIVDFLFTVREGVIALKDLIIDGDFTGQFREVFGVEEDAPIIGLILRLRDLVIDLPRRLQQLVSWVQSNREWLEPLAVGILAMVAAYKAWQGVTMAVQLVTKGFAAAQALLNAVLAANPVGIIVLAIIGLVAALTYAYHNSETFRMVVDNAFRKVQETVNNVVTWFRDTAIPWFMGGLNRIRDDFEQTRAWIAEKLDQVKAAGDNVANFFKNTIPEKFADAKEGIRRAFEGVTSFITSPIRKAIEWINSNFIDRFNGFLSDIGVSWELPRIPVGSGGGDDELPAYASGGIIAGQYDSQNRDNVLAVNALGKAVARVEPGEAVISRDNTRRMMQVGILDRSGLPRFQDGGIIGGALDFLGGPLKWVQGRVDNLLEGLGSGVWGEIIKSTLSRAPEAIVERIKGSIGALFGGGGGSTGLDFSGASMGALPANGPVTSPYGFRYGPFFGAELHDGQDIGAPYGSPVFSYLPGVVDYAGWFGGYGNYVSVTSGAIKMFYAHLSAVLAQVGQIVQAGQVIGLVGSTGFSTGPHLHWGASVNGASVDPLSIARGGYVNGTGSTGASRGWWMVGESGPEFINFQGHEQISTTAPGTRSGLTLELQYMGEDIENQVRRAVWAAETELADRVDSLMEVIG